MKHFIFQIKKQPPGRLIVIGFALVILFGTGLLLLPVSVKDGARVSFIDALFTSTSAVCVTGLIAIDVADHFTTFGQTVVAALIQIGGLGVTSIGAGLIIAARKKIGIKGRVLVKVGNPNEVADLDMGPLIEASALESMEKKVDRAIQQGARLLCGGHRIGTKGYFFEPTVLDCVTQKMDIIQEETFGPILPVVEYSDINDAIAWANDCEYGLTSSVYTQNLDNAFKVMRSLKFGETYINRENFEAMQGFHAGWRKSGIGGADGKHGLEEYLQTQVVYLETKE